MIVFLYIILYFIIICIILLILILIADIKIKLDKIEINKVFNLNDEIERIKEYKNTEKRKVSVLFINEILQNVKIKMLIEIDIFKFIPIFYVTIDNKRIKKIIDRKANIDKFKNRSHIKRLKYKSKIEKNKNKKQINILKVKSNIINRKFNIKNKKDFDKSNIKVNDKNSNKNNNKKNDKNRMNKYSKKIFFTVLENTKIENLKMSLKFGTKNASLTAIIIGYINIIFYLFISYFSTNMKKNNNFIKNKDYYYKTTPIYNNENIIIFNLKSIFSINIFNILNKMTINGNNNKN